MARQAAPACSWLWLGPAEKGSCSHSFFPAPGKKPALLPQPCIQMQASVIPEASIHAAPAPLESSPGDIHFCMSEDKPGLCLERLEKCSSLTHHPLRSQSVPLIICRGVDLFIHFADKGGAYPRWPVGVKRPRLLMEEEGSVQSSGHAHGPPETTGDAARLHQSRAKTQPRCPPMLVGSVRCCSRWH